MFLPQSAKCAGCVGWLSTLSAASARSARFCRSLRRGISPANVAAVASGNCWNCCTIMAAIVRVEAMPPWCARQCVISAVAAGATMDVGGASAGTGGGAGAGAAWVAGSCAWVDVGDETEDEVEGGQGARGMMRTRASR